MKLFLVVLFASILLAECYRILPKQLGGNREKWAKLSEFCMGPQNKLGTYELSP
jgi:hypothetical protein